MFSLKRLFILMLCACSAAWAAAPASPSNPSGFVIHRGTNLSHWLSQDFKWAPRDQWISEKDIKFIARQGFDHVRIPLDEKELWSADGKPIESEFNRLKTALGWCKKAGLRAVVDLHTVNAHHFNAANEGLTNTLWTSPTAQEHLLSLWRDLSASLRTFPVDQVAYEILNEPVADDPEDWNRLWLKCHRTIREMEPNRVLVVGANRWQMPENLPLLKVPEGDRNIILSFHTYAPMLFTHYKADWVPTKVYTGPVQYPGPVVDAATFADLTKNYDEGLRNQIGNASESWGPERLRKEYEPAIKRAQALGLQLYCGEFGCLPTVPRKDRLAYYRDLVGIFGKEGIAWANWEYKGDFGLYQWRGPVDLCGAADRGLIDALVGRHAKKTKPAQADHTTNKSK